jgi:hypothetical protein
MCDLLVDVQVEQGTFTCTVGVTSAVTVTYYLTTARAASLA